MLVRWSAAALFLSLVLAGCSDDGTPKADTVEDAGFEDLDVKATATTGVIRGVVVDERIVPIPDAEVGVSGVDVNVTVASDEQGRFAFADLQPGTYFLRVSSLQHNSIQTSVEVVAGVDEPPVTKIQLTRRFAQDPYVEAYKHDGFIQCNQAGVYYGSAPCITDFTGIVTGLGVVPPGCTPAGCAPQLRTIQDEDRGFHVAVGPGWQTLIWEMQWEEASQTFDRMGLTVSYNVTQRPASHNYLSVGSTSPLRAQLDVGVDHENSNGVEPELLDPQGRPDLYYFVGVRSSGVCAVVACAPPSIAINQQFTLVGHFFYYGVPPTDWSFIAGDPLPF